MRAADQGVRLVEPHVPELRQPGLRRRLCAVGPAPAAVGPAPSARSVGPSMVQCACGSGGITAAWQVTPDGSCAPPKDDPKGLPCCNDNTGVRARRGAARFRVSLHQRGTARECYSLAHALLCAGVPCINETLRFLACSNAYVLPMIRLF